MVQYANSPGGPPGRGFPLQKAAIIVGGGLLLIVAIGFYYWFIARVEIGADELLILVNKTGRTLPPEFADEFGDQVVLYPALVEKLAAHDGRTEDWVLGHYKGIQHRVTLAGRHWIHPYYHKRIRQKATFINQNEVGVLVRKYGKPLPFPKTVATEEDERGPVAEILRPGRHNINTLAYTVQKFPAIEIPPGHVGVVTLLSGNDPINKNTYTVEQGEKGVQRETYPPGLAYYNPYLEHIDTVDVRNQKYDMRDTDAIYFPSNDSFTITMEGTITWAIRPEKAAEVTVAYGSEEDILNKIIIPNARSIARIQGSKLQAREFIGGETRKAFQDKLLIELRNECWVQGISISDALVREIQPPAEIASLISQREQASQEIDRSTNQMEEAKSEALLVEQQEKQEQNRTLGDARRDVVTVTKQAEQREVVSVTRANREHEVAKLTLEAAEKEAAAIRSKGDAEAKVVLFKYQARAEPLKDAVAAFGDGRTYAQQFFLKKIAPSIQSILSNTEGPFAEIFRQFQAFPSTTLGASTAPANGGEQ
jgi:regulator of protease activity HflC (stomatin/prohibitin superfamily)